MSYEEEKKIYWHIGNVKTASTSIQFFLKNNFHALKQLGYNYPLLKEKSINHNDLLINCYNYFPNENPVPELFKLINQIKNEKIIISHENFSRAYLYFDNIKPFIPPVDFKIIYYIRRADKWIESLYNFLLRARRVLLTVDGHCKLSKKRIANQYKMLLAWEKVFGEQNICLRPFETQQFEKDIYDDFLMTLDITQENRELFVKPKQKSNESISPIILQYFDGKPLNEIMLNKLSKVNEKFLQKHPNMAYLSPKKALEILHEFKEIDKDMARHFLKRKDCVLFKDAWPKEGDDWEPVRLPTKYESECIEAALNNGLI